MHSLIQYQRPRNNIILQLVLFQLPLLFNRNLLLFRFPVRTLEQKFYLPAMHVPDQKGDFAVCKNMETRIKTLWAGLQVPSSIKEGTPLVWLERWKAPISTHNCSRVYDQKTFAGKLFSGTVTDKQLQFRKLLFLLSGWLSRSEL